MKNTLAFAIFAAVAVGGYFYYNTTTVVPVEYVAPVEEVVVEAPQEDILDEARRHIEQVKAQLKEEEDRLKLEIAEREARLEEINTIKISF